jgi:hypothetical protein
MAFWKENYMKKRATAIFSAIALIAILATAASTQAQSGMTMRITVPFDFAVGNETFASGDYLVDVESNPDLLKIQSKTGNATAFLSGVVIKQAWGDHPAELVFNRYGERYFLNRIWLGSVGHQLAKSKLERRVIEEDSDYAGHARVESVTVRPDSGRQPSF